MFGNCSLNQLVCKSVLQQLYGKMAWRKCFVLHTALIILLLLLQLTESANILIFGGNGFIGSACAKALLTRSHNLTLVSRGSSIYDFETRIKPFVHHIKCDRYQGVHACTELVTNNVKYDAVLDFSAYYAVVIEDALLNLRNSFTAYVYISSDSVYEVSKSSENKLSSESDAVRYQDEETRQKVNQQDMYGHYKLEAEELLVAESEKTGLQYVIFRLPDVIGPRDTTLRWWTYQTWFQYYGTSGQPFLLPKFTASTATSYVYVEDIATLLTRVIEAIAEGKTDFLNNAYNLGFPEHITLRQLLHSMQEALGVQGVEYNYSESPYYLYPSVTRGPVNISKAERVFGWKATPWKQAVQQTVSFYKEAMCKFPKERQEMVAKLQNLIPPDDLPAVEIKIKEKVAKCMPSAKEAHIEL